MSYVSAVVVGATAISAFAYIVIGFILGRNVRTLADHLPINTHGQARVKSTTEYSTTTIATTISLATVVLAFYDLAPFLGTWLLWTAITTAIGMVVVRLHAKKIFARMAAYGDRRPTLHDFLGTEYGATPIAVIGAICTATGYLGVMAVELTVGASFFAEFLPWFPRWIVVLLIAAIGLVYTSAGGFRVVVVTDRVQMAVIWALIASLVAFYSIAFAEGWAEIGRVPPDVLNFSWRPGLIAFLLGIFIINVPAFVSDMGTWQRIAGSRDMTTVYVGLTRSVIGVFVSWSLLALSACLVPALVNIRATDKWLFVLLRSMAHSAPGRILLVPVMLGLYGALFSAASTQLIALSHTVHLDLLERFKPAAHRGAYALDRHSVRLSRIIICCSAAAGVLAVQVLTAAGFSIADLVFAIFGGQIALFPVVFTALYLPRERLQSLATVAATTLAVSFVIGWSVAIAGKLQAVGNAVFLAPVVSFCIAALSMGTAVLVRRHGNTSTRGGAH